MVVAVVVVDVAVVVCDFFAAVVVFDAAVVDVVVVAFVVDADAANAHVADENTIISNVSSKLRALLSFFILFTILLYYAVSSAFFCYIQIIIGL